MDTNDRREMSALRAEVRTLTSNIDKLTILFQVQADASKEAKERTDGLEIRMRSVERWKAAFPVSTIVTIATLAIGLTAIVIRLGGG